MPLTVGTAGHVDHGKTWLVRALTGKDTDRLPEEQARGISIDLGYAPLDLPDGRRLSLVDVPGHERFVRTMVAGATGIDLFLLVVDAGEGARPQTHEHLAILRLLGVERGVVAVTKADAVETESSSSHSLKRASSCLARKWSPSARRPVMVWTTYEPHSAPRLRRKRAVRSADAALRRSCVQPARHRDRRDGNSLVGTDRCRETCSAPTPVGRDVRVRSVQVHDREVDTATAGQRVAVAPSRVGTERARPR